MSMRWLKQLVLSEYLILYLCILYFAVFSFVEPFFPTGDNMMNIFNNVMPLLIIAIGQTVVMITGGIDLSVTSVVAFTSVIGASLMTSDGGMLGGSALAAPAGILVMLVVGAMIGAVNGVAITRFHMPPFIVTLTIMMIVSGAAIWYTSSLPIYNLPVSFTMWGKGSLFNIPFAAFIVAVVMVICHFMLGRTLLGKWIYAIGRNVKTSVVSGVGVNRTLMKVYIISAICGVIGAILLTGRLETGSPVLARGMFLDVIGAAVIGGTSLFGGKGKVMWTLFGVLFITLVDNSLNLLGLSYFTIMMIKGAIILFAALMDSLRTRWSVA